MRLLGGPACAVIGLGLAGGLIGSLTLPRLMSSQLWGVQPTDPTTMAAALAVVGGVALMACARPAWQATTVDPVITLRVE